jgi:hypothetical protein
VILTGYGLSLDLLQGWEGRIFMYDPEPPALVFPIIHAGSFALPEDTSSFGSGALMRMRGQGAFFAIAEYGPRYTGETAFAHVGVPLPVERGDLKPQALHWTSPDLLGFQAMFQLRGRAFVLQLAVGARGETEKDVLAATHVLGSFDAEESDWIGM